jgi:gamma-glutamylcyclotransferase (GGCT)/AIG2-like uncharacterized protein YtfP
MHKIYVYGTLRPGLGQTVTVPGQLFDLGAFPGAVNIGDSEDSFQAEVIEVDDQQLRSLDSYEGFYADSPSSSLFIRKPYKDGFIYEYNRLSIAGRPQITDWLSYKQQERGSYGRLSARR